MDEKNKPIKEKKSIDDILASLKEREKELNCLYQVDEILRNSAVPIEEVCRRIIDVIPSGWQYPEITKARITLNGKTYTSIGFADSSWVQKADIVVQGYHVGTLSVLYMEERPTLDQGPFLKEEVRLIRTIAERLGYFILQKRLNQLLRERESMRHVEMPLEKGEWPTILKMLKQTDRNLFLQVTRKMLNHLIWSGVKKAEEIQQALGTRDEQDVDQDAEGWNRPYGRFARSFPPGVPRKIFDIASEELPDEEILELLQKWIQEEKLASLVQVVHRNLPLSEVEDALRRYRHIAGSDSDVASHSIRGINVGLIRRFFFDQIPYINVAKDHIEVSDFYDLLQKTVHTSESHGKLGGKSAGLYLAYRILQKEGRENTDLEDVKTPNSWYVTSDTLLHFMHYNNFEEVVEQKYKEVDQIRLEYPNVVQSFKNGRFPPEIVNGLSMALDDLGERPLIVRSSSLLEDRIGAAFSGKYKSLFLANQGSKRERLEALFDAIAEVYASTFGPDPIEYRKERGLLDFSEEMGIMIQEVVGTRVGKYFFPAYAGVAFSNNEFRWSPRINRKDGLFRLVPGLGTRAVDRLSDDYPILVAPGQPGLRVNVTPDEIYRYSPKGIDVINLETNRFVTMDIAEFLGEIGSNYPGIKNIISVYDGESIRKPSRLGIEMERDGTDLVATFDGLINNTSFVRRVRTILTTLETTLSFPVDIEFASDGRDFYLLQCRAQGYSKESIPAPIPKDIPRENVVFSANRYVSNGMVPDISHVVYVDPEHYGELAEKKDLLDVGRAVGKLNKILPKRKFILMGPGRWGSRGDIKLGVPVTYSDINNAAVLVEIARSKGGYVPDLSFGTHFFQDLVEAGIRYLPLYPNDENVIFNERFFLDSQNILADVLPDFGHLSNAVRLIDVTQNRMGMVLKVLMNADLDEALGILAPPGAGPEIRSGTTDVADKPAEVYWRWRMLMVERIAEDLDPERFGVQGFYVFGSTKNASAGPGSDIDILVHFRGSEEQRERLVNWLEGWSLCLDQMNHMRTGYRAGGLLDVHIITDEDVEKKTSFAAKINAVTDAARPIPLKRKVSP